MHALLAELFVVGVIVVGVGIGLWLQTIMQNTGQLAITLPSPFKEEKRCAGRVMREGHAYA